MTGSAELAATGPLLLALGVCVLAGLVSFASPCVVPLVPGYLSYLAAVVGVDERCGRRRDRVPSPRGRIAPDARCGWPASALLFVAGFTAVFLLGTVAVLGMTTTLITNQLAAATGRRRADHHDGPGVRRLHPRAAASGPVRAAACCRRVGGAPLLGAVFALGWTPCLGPTLTGVIAVASATDGASVARGVLLVIAYCLGLGIPFVLLAFGSAWAVGGPGLAAPAHPRPSRSSAACC